MMHDVKIQQYVNRRQYAKLIESWFATQWNVEPQETLDMLPASPGRPASLLAIHNTSLVGVLAYKRHQADFQFGPQLWVNALFVVPEFRRRGIARRLLRAGICASQVMPSQQIFVYTDVPRLYLSCGWDHLLTNNETGMQTLVVNSTQHGVDWTRKVSGSSGLAKNRET